MRTILLVDDDADTRSTFHDALAGAGYSVLTAIHGAEGVHLARKHAPDLILMDIRMPVMDGWHAIRYVRTDPYTAHIPIWGISAFLDEEDAHGRPAPIGFDHLVGKPILPSVLIGEIDRHFESK